MKKISTSAILASTMIGCSGVYVSPELHDVRVAVLAVEPDCMPYANSGCASMKITNRGPLPLRVNLWPIRDRNFAHGHALSFECRAKGVADEDWVDCYPNMDLLVEPPLHYRVGQDESEIIWVELPMQTRGKELRVSLLDHAGNLFRSDGFSLPDP